METKFVVVENLTLDADGILKRQGRQAVFKSLDECFDYCTNFFKKFRISIGEWYIVAALEIASFGIQSDVDL